MPNTPSADFCRPVRIDRSTLSPESRTDSRSPEVSSTAFHTRPPDLQPEPLMDVDFVVTSQLVRLRMPLIRFLFIGPCVCSTLLSDPASRRRPCASLSLHLHQAVKRTFTFELSNMLGTLAVGTTIADRPPHRSVRARLRIRLLPGMSGDKACLAACRAPCNPFDMRYPALCRAHARRHDVLPGPGPSLHNLRRRLPSLFGCFIGTTAQSDFSCTFTSAVRFMAFADRSCCTSQDVQEISRFSCMLFLSVPGS